MTKAVIYARYSSHNQREESIEGQVRECKDYAAKNGFVIVDEYIDRALTGKNDHRPSFQRLIKDSEKGQWQAVIMYTLDRFARNRYDSAIYKARLKKNGVKVYYAKQPMPDSPEGIILESVLEGYAEYYSENLARSIKRGLKENALHGVAMGSPTLGYVIQDKKYVIDPIGAEAVKTIFQMYVEGHSYAEITSVLNEKGYKTSRGNRFNKNSLPRVLANEKYIGVYSFDDVRLENTIPPIIDKDLFERAQERRKHLSTARARNKATVDYLLTGKVFCGLCGSPMIGESGTSKTGAVHHYYKCSSRKRKHNCPKLTERKEPLERIVVRYTVQTVLTDENIDKIADKAMEIVTKEMNDTSLLSALKEQRKDVSRRKTNLLTAIEQGIITETTKQRLEELETEERKLIGKISREEQKKPLLDKDRIVFWLESFRSGDIDDIEYQQRVIDTLVNSVFVYDDDKIVITYNISGNNTYTLKSSDIDSSAPLLASNPNPVIIKHCAGFVVNTLLETHR